MKSMIKKHFQHQKTFGPKNNYFWHHVFRDHCALSRQLSRRN